MSNFRNDILNEEQAYQLDVFGYVVLPGVLSADTVTRMLDLANIGVPADRRHISFAGFLGWDQAFLDLVDHPRILPIVIAMCGTGARLDSAVLFQTTAETPITDLHPRSPTEYSASADSQYDAPWRLPIAGGFTVQWALTDMPPGAGGLCCVPGSQRADRPVPRSVSVMSPHELIRQIPHKAGDVILFFEALTHGTLPYQLPEPRRTIIMKYTRGNQIYSPYEPLRDAVAGRELTRHQQLLLEPPYMRRAALYDGVWGLGPNRELLHVSDADKG